MIMINSNVEFAVAQFGRTDDPDLVDLAREIGKLGVHWYIFDGAADKDFELRHLCNLYKFVFLCKSTHDFMEVKYEENI